MKFSVIIPVYQAEKTISRCLNSLLDQQFDDFELVVVNDGSVDHSSIICKKYAERDNRVHYYEKENGGVSSARNMGLSLAQGEYILFVDSDDYVYEGYFQEIDFALRSYSPDLLLFGNIRSRKLDHPLNCYDFYMEEETELSRVLSGLIRTNQFNSLFDKCFLSLIIKHLSKRELNWFVLISPDNTLDNSVSSSI